MGGVGLGRGCQIDGGMGERDPAFGHADKFKGLVGVHRHAQCVGIGLRWRGKQVTHSRFNPAYDSKSTGSNLYMAVKVKSAVFGTSSPQPPMDGGKNFDGTIHFKMKINFHLIKNRPQSSIMASDRLCIIGLRGEVIDAVMPVIKLKRALKNPGGFPARVFFEILS
jgi:hypothetical protein